MNTIQCHKCNATAKQIVESPQHAVYRCMTCRAIIEVPHTPGAIKTRFSCFDHQGKASLLIRALETKYERVLHADNHYFVFSDSDVSGRMMQMQRMKPRGVKRFFIYPHAARPSMINTYYPTWDGVTAQFVVNEYHAEVLRAYGYEKPLEIMGWHLSPVEAFKPRNMEGKPIKVLFAPIHPRNAEVDRQANYETFTRLYRLVLSGEIELTIRHIGEIQESGLPTMKDVIYVNGVMNQATHDMEQADVIIGHQTFAWLAVARGFPCVMFAEDMPVHFRINNQYHDVASWNLVHHLFRYPLDILCEDDTIGLLRRAVKSDEEIKDWKCRMIGKPFETEAFLRKVEKYL